MASMSLLYNKWLINLSESEFCIFWLILETVLDEGKVREDPQSLDYRLSEFIDRNHLVMDVYNSVMLDGVIGDDDRRFQELLAKAIHLIYWFPPQSKDGFWTVLKRPQAAYDLGAEEYGDPVNRYALIGLILRLSLPWLLPPEDHLFTRELGWTRVTDQYYDYKRAEGPGSIAGSGPSD